MASRGAKQHFCLEFCKSDKVFRQLQATRPHTQDLSETPATCAHEHDSSHICRLYNIYSLALQDQPSVGPWPEMDIPKYYHDLNEIRDGLYLGSRRAEHSLPLATLQDFYGITHVVQASLGLQVSSCSVAITRLETWSGRHTFECTLQVGTNDFMSPTHAGSLKYCCVRALDFEGEDLLTKLKNAEVHSFIDDARSNGGKVLVHCLVRHFPALYYNLQKVLWLAEQPVRFFLPSSQS